MYSPWQSIASNVYNQITVSYSKIMLKVGQKLYTFSVRKIHFNSIGVIGVPFSKGQPKGGVAGGPKAIRDAGLIGRIADIR